MDKKQLEAIVSNIVKAVMARCELTEESEARTMVGMALRANAEGIVASINVPKMVFPAPAA